LVRRKAVRILLDLLVRCFTACGPLVIGIDETLERRQGDKIAGYPLAGDGHLPRRRTLQSQRVRQEPWSALDQHDVLAPIPWAARVWALPFLSVLAPSERYDQQRGRRHKTLAQWAGQMITQVRRWLPERSVVLVADGGYSVLTLLDRCARLRGPVTMVTRLRLDAALYEPAPQRQPGQMGRPRKKGKRLATLQQVLQEQQTALDAGNGAALVQPARAAGRGGFSLLRLVPRRHAAGADPLCTDS
jgi:hypothetical protein